MNLDDELRSSTIVLADEPCSGEQQLNISGNGSIVPQMQPRYRNLRPRKRPVESVSRNDKKRHRAAGLKLADVPCSQTQCPGMRKKDVVVPRMQVKFHNTRSRKRPLETEPLGVKKRSCPALKRSTIRVTPTVIETDAYSAMDIAAFIGTETAAPIVDKIVAPIETEIAAPIVEPYEELYEELYEGSLPPSTQLHTPTQQPNTYPPSQASVQHPPPPTTTPPPPLLLGADSPSAAGSRKDRTAPAD